MNLRRLITWLILPTTAILALSSFPYAAKGKTKSRAKLYPYSGFLDLQPADLEPGAREFAGGAPAVVLLEARQHDWEGLDFQRINYFRRVKVLDESGLHDLSNFRYELLGDWRVREVNARTILPDGTAVDAAGGVIQERSKETGIHVVNVAFPQVTVGAILDLHVAMTAGFISVPPWIIQGDLPVLESELVMVPPTGLRFRSSMFAVPDDRVRQSQIQAPGGRRATVWTISKIAPLPAVAHRPPPMEIGARLVIILDSYKDDLQFLPFATDWKSFIAEGEKTVNEWVRRSHGQVDALARQVAAEEPTPKAKAEAIRRALRDRVRTEFLWTVPLHDSPDEALAKGQESSGGVARLALAMLRAVDVDAHVALIRRRGSGLVPADLPFPSLYDDVLIRIEQNGAPVWISPTSEFPAGILPWDCRGVLAVVLNGKLAEPTVTTDLRSVDHLVQRATDAALDRDGRLTGKSTLTLHDAAAERWRRRLAEVDDQVRRGFVQDELRRWVPDLALTALQLQDLDDPTKPLVASCEWSSEGYATRAGGRLLVNPSFFDRIAAADWPPTERTVPVDLGTPFDSRDRLRLRLPDAVGEVTLLEPAHLNAGPVGSYEVTIGRNGSVLEFSRSMRLDIFRFTAAQYPQLRRWFADIAAADDRLLVLALP